MHLGSQRRGELSCCFIQQLFYCKSRLSSIYQEVLSFSTTLESEYDFLCSMSSQESRHLHSRQSVTAVTTSQNIVRGYILYNMATVTRVSSSIVYVLM